MRSLVSVREAAVAVLFAAAGWTVSAAVFSLSAWVVPLQTALAVHGVVMPLVFVLVALVYFGRRTALRALPAAVLFASVTLALEIVGPRLLVDRSYEPLTSVLGTWLPVLFVLVVTWLTGIGASQSTSRRPLNRPS
jgi:hypothetical protein